MPVLWIYAVVALALAAYLMTRAVGRTRPALLVWGLLSLLLGIGLATGALLSTYD